MTERLSPSRDDRRPIPVRAGYGGSIPQPATTPADRLARDPSARSAVGGRSGQAGAAPDTWSVLTPREREIAAHVSGGGTDREIARSLVISPRTVHKHLEQIYRKLGVRSRTGLVVLMYQRHSHGQA